MTLQWTTNDVNRFMRKVVVLPGRLILPSGRETCACWLWIGARSIGKGNRLPYGSFHLGKRTIRAHRFSCEAIGGLPPPPPDHHRDHECFNSLCVCPYHFEIVHREENQRRKMERNR